MTTEITTTSDYTRFKLIKGNREINGRHVESLKKSMQRKYLPVPILVNKKMQVIDGQHRLQACRELSLPVAYTVISDADISDVSDLNTHAKNWSSKDFIHMHKENGNQEFAILEHFINKWKFDLGSSLALFSRGSLGWNGITMLKQGTFKATHINWANESAEKIYMVKPYYNGYRRRSFVYAMIRLFKNPDYDHDHFLQKLEFNSTKMVHCTDTDQYLKLIEEIYNWKTQVKVRLF